MLQNTLQNTNLHAWCKTRQGQEEKCIHSVIVFIVCFSTKIEKEKREHAKQHGMIRTEITGAEIAEEMEKERRLFQLQMCEVGGEMKLGWLLSCNQA